MDAAQRTQLRSLLLRLVMPTEDGDPVRARVPRAKVAADEAHQRLVEQLVEARLVSIDGDTVQIAHEALVRVWPRLRGWLDDDVDGQRLFRHLAGAADAWDAMGRPDSELYRGARLGRTLEWRERATPDLNDTEAAFLDASVALAESEDPRRRDPGRARAQVNRRLRGALAGVGVLLLLALVAGCPRRTQSRTRNGSSGPAPSTPPPLRTPAEPAPRRSTTGFWPRRCWSRSQPSGSTTPRHRPGRTSRARLRQPGRCGSGCPPVPTAVTWPSRVAVSGDGALVASSNPVGGVQLYDARPWLPSPSTTAHRAV